MPSLGFRHVLEIDPANMKFDAHYGLRFMAWQSQIMSSVLAWDRSSDVSASEDIVGDRTLPARAGR
jgi:hypothetical protein